MPRPILLLLALCLLLALPVVRADVAVPPNVLNPATPTEAWNVIRLATTNIETLLKEKRLDELAIQVSLCSPALRTLARTAASPTERAQLEEAATRAFRFINMTAEGGIAKDLAKAETGYAGLHGVLAEMAKVYDPKVLNAEIHFCPMHPEFVSVNAATPCDKCGMGLLQRRIPYSFIYVAPGEPSLKLSVTADAPLEVGLCRVK